MSQVKPRKARKSLGRTVKLSPTDVAIILGADPAGSGQTGCYLKFGMHADDMEQLCKNDESARDLVALALGARRAIQMDHIDLRKGGYLELVAISAGIDCDAVATALLKGDEQQLETVVKAQSDKVAELRKKAMN